MTDPVTLAQQFHEAYERLAPTFGYSTRSGTKIFDSNTQNGRLMIAVCQEIIDRIQINAKAALLESFKAGFEADKLEKNPESF